MAPTTRSKSATPPPSHPPKDLPQPLDDLPQPLKDLPQPILHSQSTTSHKRSHDGSSDKEDEGHTTPPSKTLKHTTIEDKSDVINGRISDAAPTIESAEPEGKATTSQRASKSSTPEPTPRDTTMGERLASPKKKRGRDQIEDGAATPTTEKMDPPHLRLQGDESYERRSLRAGPEKKRPRDASVPPPTLLEDTKDMSETVVADLTTKDDIPADAPSRSPSTKTAEAAPVATVPIERPQTSSSAFAASGFGSLANTSSGFATLANKPSVFGSAFAASKPATTGSLGSFGSSTTTTIKPSAPLSFTSAATATSAFGVAASNGGFGGLNGSKSVFGGGFGTTLGGGAKLSSFAGVAASPATEKVAKPFGAPESDPEDESDANDSDKAENSDDEEEALAGGLDEKKKSKLGKVQVDDGEVGEATLLQFRGKLFAIGSKDAGWKEKGVGNVKLNVPIQYIEYDDFGCPIPGTFDPSNWDRDDGPEPTPARLIMRQENTGKVILNTPIIGAQEFVPKPSTTSVQIMFTAFDEGKPTNVLLRMSEVNSRSFLNEIKLIQREIAA